ncbi:hypothetical protein D3C73_1635430 [compost metagenome]
MRVHLGLQRMQLGVLLTDGGQLHAFDQFLNPPDHPVEGSDQNIDFLIGRHIYHTPEVSDFHLFHLPDQFLER